MDREFLCFENVGKVFPGVRALDGVTFGVAEGSVHALLGENGAGKSTLLKILSGVHPADEGRMLLNGEPKSFRTTFDAIAAGVAVIYQELQLVPDMTVAENLYLGHLPSKAGWVNRRKLTADSARLLAMLGEEVSPGAKLGSLSIGQRQMVEIAKALSRDAKVIAFDEPTSSLSSREVERLFGVIRDLKAHGKVILYVTHRMEEVFQICDSATVLRDGRHIETFADISGIGRSELVSRMVGRSIEDIFGYEPREHGERVLEVSGVTGPGLAEPAEFTVDRGEIVGFFGLVGAGRTELMKLVYGATPRSGGKVSVLGKPLAGRRPKDAISAGLMFCPEDRKKEGIIPIRSVMENLNISGRRHSLRAGMFLNERWEKQNAEKYVQKLGIRTPSLAQLIVNLSGGNQQKVILGRWLCEDLKVVLLDEPTRGIDVGAKSEIYAIIYDLAKQGAGVVVVSSELPEVLGVCDRIVVMGDGRIKATLTRAEADQETVMRLALPDASGQEAKAT